MIVAAFVVHRDPVALTGFHDQRIDIRPGFAVDRPAIKPAVTAGNFFKDEVEAVIRFRSRRIRAKDGVIPSARLRFRPLRRAALPGVFDHDTHAHSRMLVFGGAENPHSRLFHLDDGIDAFRGGER